MLHILRRCGVILVYIDDWILLGASEDVIRMNMEAFDMAMTSLGFKLHPTKRDGPTQSIEYIGFLLHLASARLAITGDKKDKVLAHVDALIAQVALRSWDLSYADTVTGKLSAISPVVPGGRSAITPSYKARTITAASWKNPHVKTPKELK